MPRDYPSFYHPDAMPLYRVAATAALPALLAPALRTRGVLTCIRATDAYLAPNA